MIGSILHLYDVCTIEQLCADLPAHAREEACGGVQAAVLGFGIAVDYENREITKRYLDDWGRKLAAVRTTIRTLEQNRGIFASVDCEVASTVKNLQRMEEALSLLISTWRGVDANRGQTSSAEHETGFIVQIAHVWAKAHGIEFSALKMSESRDNAAMTFIERVVEPALTAAKSRKAKNLPRHIKETLYKTRKQMTG
ncbi:hypothetical protein [Jiella avicenniae]|uniref:Uncharacterized protein n=1 Tax=Jiella avicenniae TaxID=2907202 RepID=A0A9X1NZY3_9HYPH|nr:hypothetical protein [Jiella avicenniae]MCE7028920.1 hypothetical protein [Jiella avicenniae]